MKKVPRESGVMKKVLTSAFLELMKQKEYADITVTDIVKYAGVSRMAYYRTFSSKEEILVEYLKSLTAQLQEKIESGSRFDKAYICRLIFCMIAEHKTVFRSLVEANLTEVAVSSILETMYAVAEEFYHYHSYDKETGYEICYHIGGLINTARVWIESGMTETTDEMSEMVSRFSGEIRAFFVTAG